MVEGGMKLIKCLLFVFNVIFTIVGIALIAVGAYVQTQLKDVAAIFGNEFYGPGILLIVVGVIIFIIAFLGCCGAVKENYCCIMTFGVLLGIIFVLMIAGGIAGYVFRNTIETVVFERLQETEQKYNQSDVQQAWDFIQRSFKCCGANGTSDWQGIVSKPPESCCKVEGSPACDGRTFTDTDALNDKSCKNGIENWLKDNVAIVGGTGIGLAFIVILGVILACCLGRSIKKEYEVV